MFTLSKRRVAILAGGSLFVISSSLAFAAADDAQPLPQITVTATRTEQPQSQSGSAITVVSAEEIAKYGSTGLGDVLRGVPGLDITQTGGVGSATSVSLRGSSPGQTLVLIDGVRIGDPSVTDGSVDLGGFTTNNIERIEVLRGPQSALYGSDAMGGVINIITRQGQGEPHGSVSVEGGSYGTVHTRADAFGRQGDWSYAFSIDGVHTDGFPGYGYRVKGPLTIGDGVTPLPPLPSIEPANKGGGTARLVYHPTEDISVEGSFNGYDSGIHFDNPYAYVASDVFNGFNRQNVASFQGYLRADVDAFDKLLHNRLTLFGNETNRDIWQTEGCYDASGNSLNCRTGYRGGRQGVEYQGDLKLGAFGLATFGAKTETETARTAQEPDTPGAFTPLDASQTTNSVFAQHQFTLFNRLDFTYGGRIDAVPGNRTFDTWRSTVAYRIEETGTKLRASAGTGAKVASLYQRFSQYGDPSLNPEQSAGYDVGVDQKLLNGRVTASVGYFENSYRNLIDYGYAPTCTSTQVFGCYYNVGRARTQGIELSGEASVIPDVFRLRASYTYLDARDLTTQLQLLHHPRDKGSVSAIYTGVPKLELEARVIVVGANPDYDFINYDRVVLPAYAKIDLFANYKLDHGVSLFGRIENLGNVRYEEVLNYGTPGRSVYGGVKYEW